MTLTNTKQDFLTQFEAFRQILGKEFVFTDEDSLNNYAHDETENLHFLPEQPGNYPRFKSNVFAGQIIRWNH